MRDFASSFVSALTHNIVYTPDCAPLRVLVHTLSAFICTFGRALVGDFACVLAHEPIRAIVCALVRTLAYSCAHLKVAFVRATNTNLYERSITLS